MQNKVVFKEYLQQNLFPMKLLALILLSVGDENPTDNGCAFG